MSIVRNGLDEESKRMIDRFLRDQPRRYDPEEGEYESNGRSMRDLVIDCLPRVPFPSFLTALALHAVLPPH